MAFIQMNVMSECLMRTVNVNVILPADKITFPGMPKQEIKEYKTLYLLHGIFGSQVDWINGTMVQRWAEDKNLAVVMPAGENMFYVDQEKAHNLYGEFIGREQVELTRKMFPLSHRREDTFIAGLSMGGYGALRNGLKYSDTFGYVAGLSSADIVDGLEERTDDAPFFIESRSYAEAVFGDLSLVRGSDKDIKHLAGQLKSEGKELPKVYLACGVDDSLLGANKSLKDCFTEHGYDVTYEEGPGAHEWDFWNRHIQKVIDWLPLDGTAGVNSGNVM